MENSSKKIDYSDVVVPEQNNSCKKCNGSNKEKKNCSKCQETKKFLTWSFLISFPIFLFAVYGIIVSIRNLIEYLSQ